MKDSYDEESWRAWKPQMDKTKHISELLKELHDRSAYHARIAKNDPVFEASETTTALLLTEAGTKIIQQNEEIIRLKDQLNDAGLFNRRLGLLAGGFLSGSDEAEKLARETDYGRLSLIGMEKFRMRVDETVRAIRRTLEKQYRNRTRVER